MKALSLLFALMSAICFVVGFYTEPYYFYLAAMAAIISGAIYVAEKIDLNLK